jgi:hypothetical protein
MATETKPTLSERRRAFVAEALMIRALAYRAARNRAEERGADLSADPVAPGFKADERTVRQSALRVGQRDT